MRQFLSLYLVIVAGLCLAAPPSAQAQSGSVREYPQGWNLVALPPGSAVPTRATLFTLQPGDTDYVPLPAASGLQAGFGYWIFFESGPNPTSLGLGSTQPYKVTPASGQWVLIGDPSGTLPASITGADAVYVYDPTTPAGWSVADTLVPGQGGIALSSTGSQITVTPLPATVSTLPNPLANLVARWTKSPATKVDVMAWGYELPNRKHS